jgi:hypothetical protein
MVEKSGTWRIPPGFWSIALVIITVIMLCLAAGCTGSSGNAKSPGNSGNAGNSGADNGGSGGGSSGGGDSGGGSGASTGSDETETSTWHATVSGRETVRTVMAYVDKGDPKSSKNEETTSTLQFQGSFPVVVDHQKDYTGKDIYTRKFVEGGSEYPVSGSYTEHSTSLETGGYAGCHPMASYTFDYDEQGTIDKTDFDFGFYPDGQMVQLDGSYDATTHSKGVSSDGKCDHEETETNAGAFWFQCNSADEDAKGTEFERGQRDFRMDGSSYVITCHVTDVREMEDDDSVTYTSPSSTTRDITMKVVLDPVPPTPKKLKAIPGGPYTTERGTPLQLDGSKSTGSILKYTWTFSPGTGCPAGLSLDSAELTGSQPSATVLCPVTAKLTVSDGKSSDSASVPVSVAAREWDTPFSMSAEGIDKGPMATPPWFNSMGYAGYEGGANVCGLCRGTATEDSNLHPPAKGGSWEQPGGYQLTQVTEPGGPFDTYWYVSDYALQMNRMIVVNPFILPPGSGGKELPYGMGSFYQKNKDSRYAIDGYVAGVRQHEADHTGRMKAALAAKDPAKTIEPLINTDKNAIRDKADSTLHATEKDICTKSSDASQPPMRVTWTGKMLFPTSDTNQWKEGETDVGGYRVDAGESCG